MPSTQDQTPGPVDPSRRRRPTLSDVAAMAGVSVSTVSRALDGNPRIPADTQRKVVEAATALGFRRNISARSLRTQSSMLIGVVVPDIAIAFYATVLKAAQNVLEAAGYQVVVMNTERDAQHESAALRTLQARQVDGLLIATTGGYVPDWGPVVFFDHIIRNTGLGYVSPDNDGGMSTLVEHLAVVHGHTRIAFLGAPTGPTDRIQRMENAPATERLEAFRNVMGRLRLPVPPEYLAYGDYEWTEASAQRAVAELMRLDQPPTAIVAAGDTLALGALRQLRAARHKVGTEIALVSFDDPVSSDLLDPPMTALGRHDRELGEIGARMLLDAIDAGKSGTAPKTGTTEIRVPLDLIVRRSCGCAPEPPESEPSP
ncbi:LacI family DNA-binding transcriptional regulator [Streptomyces sp. NBC_01262]|uniref:LacI family DNA-binding transcriptional regulator n=1 Tax=Streptomyces sp. NBC_01262 TaxID=2903803 RepID=UPI002E3337C2|nr:LacI family DNA-binding transcriptional regulator [Streptomyces sp. NBC_01262]